MDPQGRLRVFPWDVWVLFFVILWTLGYFTGSVWFFGDFTHLRLAIMTSTCKLFSALSCNSSLANISYQPKCPSLINMFATHVGCYTANVVLFGWFQEVSDPRGRNDPGQRFLKQITLFCIQDIFDDHLHRASQCLTICLQLLVEP